MIHYDRSRFSIVVVCDACGFTDVGVTKESAWSLAADHEARAHPESRQIREAARVRAARKSIDV